MSDFKAKGGRAKQLPAGKAKNPISTASRHIAGRGEAGKGKTAGRGANTIPTKPVVSVAEVAPPGAKAERMVKHIKKGYAKDGNLSKKEKGIAYATAWKAHNKGQVEEGVKFGDIVKNSKAELKKAKPAMVKESRVMEETDYFYEKIGKSLAEKNPTLDTASGDFVTAVRQEMIAHGIEPNRARNIIKMDDDFISDVATSYGHCCQEIAECGAPMNSFLGDSMKELDEIAALAGLARAAAPAAAISAMDEDSEIYNTVNQEEVADDMDESVGSTPMLNGKAININSIEVDGVNDWDSPDFADAYITYATFADGTPLSDEELVQLENEHGELVNQAAHGSLQGRADFVDEVVAPPKATPGKAPSAKATGMAPAKPGVPPTPTFNEEEVEEGNEFSGALAKAKASGAKEFEVDGKKYTVKEDVNINISANGDEDAMNLIRKLAGMPVVAVAAQEAEPVVDMTGEALEEDGPKERDIEYTNTPREETAGLDAAIPAGADLNRAKKQYKKEYPGDNPMAVKEEALWKSYEAMINDVKK
jgi:hypothetical protein